MIAIGAALAAELLLGCRQAGADLRLNIPLTWLIIEGLYAAGIASAPVLGHTYAGPGAAMGHPLR